MKKTVCAILIAVLLWTGAVAEWDWPGLWITNSVEPNEQIVIILNLSESGKANMHAVCWTDGRVLFDYEFEYGTYSHAYNTAYVDMNDTATVSMVISENGNCYGLLYMGDERIGIFEFIKVPKTKSAP